MSWLSRAVGHIPIIGHTINDITHNITDTGSGDAKQAQTDRENQLRALGISIGGGIAAPVSPVASIDSRMYQAAPADAMPATPVSTIDQPIDQMGANLYTAAQQGPSAAAAAQSDPAAVWAQHAALAEMARTYGMGGLNEIDRARMAQDRAEQSQQAKAQELAIMQNAQEQGRGGGNAQLMAQLQSQQGAANRMSMADLQTQALGLQRRDQLLQEGGQLAGNINAQTFGQNFQRGGAADTVNQYNTQGVRNLGSAQDAINQFNAMGERGRATFNAGAQNTAAEDYAAREAQRRAAFANAQNEASRYNTGAEQGYYGDLYGRQQDVANVYGGQGAQYQGIANQKAGVFDTRLDAAIGAAAGGGPGAAVGANVGAGGQANPSGGTPSYDWSQASTTKKNPNIYGSGYGT